MEAFTDVNPAQLVTLLKQAAASKMIFNLLSGNLGAHHEQIPEKALFCFH